jgi:signal peptidase II
MAADSLSTRPTPRPGLGRPALLAYAVAVATIALDQLSKWWVLDGLDLPVRGQVGVLPPWLNLTLVHNAGVSFGLFRGGAEVGRWLLTAFSLLVAAGLGWWTRGAARPLTGLAVGLVIGGSIGNAVDRIRLGVVTDFVDVSALHFPWVFNGADSAITVGVALLVLESLLTPDAAKKP